MLKLRSYLHWWIDSMNYRSAKAMLLCNVWLRIFTAPGMLVSQARNVSICSSFVGLLGSKEGCRIWVELVQLWFDIPHSLLRVKIGWGETLRYNLHPRGMTAIAIRFIVDIICIEIRSLHANFQNISVSPLIYEFVIGAFESWQWMYFTVKSSSKG